MMTIKVYIYNNKMGKEVDMIGVVEEVINSYFYKVAFAEYSLIIDIREAKYELL